MQHKYELHVEVRSGGIVVTLPDSIYSVTYYKSPQGSCLAAKMLPTTYDPNAELTSAEFLARAWKLANDKARELGWIV